MNSNIYYQKNKKATLMCFVTDCLGEIRPTASQSQAQVKPPATMSGANQRTLIGRSYLTQRERDCIVALLKMKFYNQVATGLGLSIRTVEYYIENIKRKYDLATKKQLIAYFSHYF